jgi:hypothetical protein
MTLRAVHVRLSVGLADALDAAATAEGISPTGWVRAALVRALPGYSDVGSLPPSARRRPAVVPPEDLAVIARLVGEVGRATGATIQLARSLREAGSMEAHAEAEAVLKGLRSAQADLVTVVSTLRETPALIGRPGHGGRA